MTQVLSTAGTNTFSLNTPILTSASPCKVMYSPKDIHLTDVETIQTACCVRHYPTSHCETHTVEWYMIMIMKRSA